MTLSIGKQLTIEEAKEFNSKQREFRSKYFGCTSTWACEGCGVLVSDSPCMCVGHFICPKCGYENGKISKTNFKLDESSKLCGDGIVLKIGDLIWKSSKLTIPDSVKKEFNEQIKEIKNKAMSEFITKDSGEREQFDTGAKRDIREGKGRFDLVPTVALRRYAELLERGAVKYNSRGWEQGMPLCRYYDSAMRHLISFMEREETEDHLAAVIFNVAAIIHHLDLISKGKLPKELDDRP